MVDENESTIAYAVGPTETKSPTETPTEVLGMSDWRQEPLEDIIPAGKLDNLRSYFPGRTINTVGDIESFREAELHRPKAMGRKTVQRLLQAVADGKAGRTRYVPPPEADPNWQPMDRIIRIGVTVSMRGEIEEWRSKRGSLLPDAVRTLLRRGLATDPRS